MGLAGRLRAARPRHAARETRPLRKKRGESEKEGQETRTPSNPERQSCVTKKPPYLSSSGCFSGKKVHEFSLENSPENSKVICTGRNESISLCRKVLIDCQEVQIRRYVHGLHHNASQFRSSPIYLNLKHISGYHAGSAGNITCPKLATPSFMTSRCATSHFSILCLSSSCPFISAPKLFFFRWTSLPDSLSRSKTLIFKYSRDLYFINLF